MTLRFVLWTAVVALLSAVDLWANQRANQPGQSAERLSVTGQQALRLTIAPWIEPTPKRFGVFTLTPPERRSEMIRVSVPIGEVAMRAANAIGRAQYRRAEQEARKEVEQAMKEFGAAQR